MIENKLHRIREGFERRRDAINKINFTYKRLQDMLPVLMKRLGPPVSHALARQHREDRAINERLWRIALEHGQPPGPCICEEGGALIEEVHHADRATRPSGRASAIIHSLMQVRIFLIRTWARLISELHIDDHPEFRKEAIALQQREADQHRELVTLGLAMEDAVHRQAGDRLMA